RERNLLPDVDPEGVEDRPQHRGRAALVDDLAGPARGFDALASGLGERVGVDGQLLRQLAPPEDLHRHVLARPEPGGAQRLEVDRRAVVEPRVQVFQVDRLGVRAERLERHRHLLVRAAQLAHPHVDRVLAALEAGAILGARAGAVALLAAAGGLARARALAAADALARPARARGRLEVVEPDALACARRRSRLGIGLLGLVSHHFSSTTTRCRTLWTI